MADVEILAHEESQTRREVDRDGHAAIRSVLSVHTQRIDRNVERKETMIITGVTEEQFYRELQVNCFINQIGGYPVGHPERGLEYRPIVPFKKNDDGTYNRSGTLEMTAFSFTDEEKKILMEKI